AKMAAIGVAAVAAAIGGAAYLFIQAYSKQEHAERQLRNALIATGQEVDANSARLRQLASDLQAITTYEDEALTELMVLATQFGVSADKMEDVTKATIGLSNATGGKMGLEEALRAVTMAMNGEFMMLQRYVPSIRTATTEAEKMAALNDFVNKGFQMAQGEVETITGRYAQFKNRVGDLAEAMGEALVPALNWAFASFDKLVVIIERNIPAIQGWIGSLLSVAATVKDFVAPVLKWFATAVIYAFSTISVVIENWRDVVRTALLGFAYESVKTFNVVAHWLTVVLPDLLAWFARNWKEYFTDVANFYATVFTNLWKNTTEFFGALWDWIKNGGGLDWKWTALTDGFVSTLEELPVIAKRTIGGLEQELGDALGAAVGDLWGKVEGKAKPWLNRLGLGGEAPTMTPEEKQKEDEAAKRRDELKTKEIKLEKMGSKPGKEGKGDKGAQFEGLTETWKRIQQAAAGKREDPATVAAKKGAVASEKTAESSKKSSTALDKIYELLVEVKRGLPLVGNYGR
ncbi:hypothetical protein IMZ48_11525, partial [Candidatus Bathyarchaeota archaeon]|nr:hypothetical protein [Candidatus Bathyarchaeota archaeon]